MRQALLPLFVFAGLAGGALAIAAIDDPEGRIGPDSGIQPSGRQLDPTGKLTKLGNLPAGGALTVNRRFAWTLSAGRGHNDIRIVRVRRGCAGAADPQRCRRRRAPGPNASGLDEQR